MRKIIFILVLILLSYSIQAGSYAGDFLVIGNGVRAAGMGGAFSAVANDASAIYWNSSGLSQLRRTEVSLMRAFLYQNLASYDNFNFCQPLPNEVTIGFNWTRLTVDDIPVFLEAHLVKNVDFRSSFYEFNLSGIPDGKITSTDDVLQISFAKHVHHDLSLGWLFFDLPFDLHFGGNIKYIKRKIDENVGSGTGFDTSILVRTDLGVLLERDYIGDFAFGLNFQNVGGTTITWDTDSSNEDKILFNTKLGLAFFQPIEAFHSNITLSTDIDYIYNKTYHHGLEISYKDNVEGRVGLQNGDFSAGLSLKLYEFILDYAFITNVIANTNRVGLRFTF